MKTHENKVTGPYAAVVRGKPTGLSGCDTSGCPRFAACLRSDAKLKSRFDHACTSTVSYFIARGQVSA